MDTQHKISFHSLKQHLILAEPSWIAGVPSCASKELLNDNMRSKWGFNGYITSDCGAVGNVAFAEPSGHGFTHDDSNLTAKTTLEAGMDNDCGRYFGADNGTLAEALSSGYVPKESWMPPLKNLFRVQMVLQNGDAFSISSCPAR